MGAGVDARFGCEEFLVARKGRIESVEGDDKTASNADGENENENLAAAGGGVHLCLEVGLAVA